MTQNAGIILAVLAAATIFGVLRKRTDGRMRMTAGGTEPTALAESTAAPAAPAAVAPAQLTAADLAGHPLGARATFVQFSSEICQPCRATARVLTAFAAETPGVAHVELDAEHHADLARRLSVRRTPTVFLLDAGGAVSGRAAGAMRRQDALTALGGLG